MQPPPAQGSPEAPLFEFSAFAPSDADAPTNGAVPLQQQQQQQQQQPLQQPLQQHQAVPAGAGPTLQHANSPPVYARGSDGQAVLLQAVSTVPVAQQMPPPAYVGTSPHGSRTSAHGSASVRRPSDKSLFVSGLHPNCEFTHLHERFQQYGKIISCRVLRDAKTGNSRCIGYVNFANANDATAAVAKENGLNGPQGGGPLTIRYAEDDPAFTPEETKKLFIRYVPTHFNADQLRQVYSQFGAVTDCSVMPDISAAAKQEATPWNMGYVTFATAEEATFACAKSNKTFLLGDQHEVSVKPAESLATRAQRQRKHDGSTSSRTSFGMGSGSNTAAFGSGGSAVLPHAGSYATMPHQQQQPQQPPQQQLAAPPGFQIAYLPTANGTLTPVYLPIQQPQQATMAQHPQPGYFQAAPQVLQLQPGQNAHQYGPTA